jgi:hypothetical protein
VASTEKKIEHWLSTPSERRDGSTLQPDERTLAPPTAALKHVNVNGRSADAEQERTQQSRERKGARQTQDNAQGNQLQSLAHDLADDVCPLRAQRHSQSYL